MKKILYIVIIAVLVIVAIMYLVGSFGSIFSGLSSTPGEYTDQAHGFSFSYPPTFSFKKNTFSLGYISDVVDGAQLQFAFAADSSYTGLCDGLAALVKSPPPNRFETFSKEEVNGNTVYREVDLSGYSPAGYVATYAVLHQSSCLSMVETNKKNDFGALEWMLNSLKFK